MRGQQLVIQDAIEDSFQEAVRDGKAAMKRKRPLQPDNFADVERLLGPETPAISDAWTAQQEDRFLADWDQNPLKAEFEGIALNNAHLAKLWNTSCAIMRCSPVSIISPRHSIAYNNPENDDEDDDNDDEAHSQLWPRAFCEALSTLICHLFWRADQMRLVTAIQFAVICRKGMKSPWLMPMPKTHDTDIEWLRETVAKPCPVGSTLQQVCLDRKRAIEAEIPGGSCMDFAFFCHVASLIKAPDVRLLLDASANTPAQYVLHGSGDLKVLIKALDTFRNNTIVRIFPSAECASLVARQCISQKAMPAGKDVKEYQNRSFLHELRISAQNAALPMSSQEEEEEEEVRSSKRRKTSSRRSLDRRLPVTGLRQHDLVIDDDSDDDADTSHEADAGHGCSGDDYNVDDADAGHEADSNSNMSMRDGDGERSPASRYSSLEEFDNDEFIQEDSVNQSRSDSAAATPGTQPRSTRASPDPLTPQLSDQPPTDNDDGVACCIPSSLWSTGSMDERKVRVWPTYPI